MVGASAVVLGIGLGPGCGSPEKAADVEKGASAAPASDASTGQAVERALSFLAGRQGANGSYGSVDARGRVAVTAFVGRTMMAAGSRPGSGPHGEHLSKMVDYLLGCVDESGLITAKEPIEPPMYGHAFSLIFLAECQAAAPRPELKEKIAKAVALTVKSQNREGGWRYRPDSEDADLSVTVAQVMALVAARDAGIEVPEDTVGRAVEYVRKSQNPDGGFRYLIAGGTCAFARSAAAVAALSEAGAGAGGEARKGIDYVSRFPPADTIGQPEVYYFYGHYYAAQVMRRAGEKVWERWYGAVRDKLLEQQAKDGSWPDTASVELGTAMACLTLQSRYAPAGGAPQK